MQHHARPTRRSRFGGTARFLWLVVLGNVIILSLVALLWFLTGASDEGGTRDDEDCSAILTMQGQC